MNGFEPLLRSKWTASSLNTATINGVWAEDEGPYEFKVPVQLVKPIVAMQNYVYEMYKEIADREKFITRLSKELDEYKAARGYKE